MYTLRHARREDIPQILAIYAPYIETTNISFEYQVPSLEEYETRFVQYTEQFPWIVVESSGKIAGFAYASPAFARAAYQWNAELSVYISEQHQRRGLARALYGCLEALLALQGYYRLYAVVTSGNANSFRFHEALGFTLSHTLTDVGFKRGVWCDVYFYLKQLCPAEGTPSAPVACHMLAPEKTLEIFIRYEQEINAQKKNTEWRKCI